MAEQAQAAEPTFKEQVEEVLEMVRPALQMDGGDLQLVEANEESGMVKIHFVGACSGCPMSTMTLQMGIERALKSRIPDCTGIEAV